MIRSSAWIAEFMVTVFHRATVSLLRLGIPIVLSTANLIGEDLVFIDSQGAVTEGPIQSSNGVAGLAWRGGPDGDYNLEQDRDPNFESPIIRYSGPAQEAILTGLDEGSHFFRVRLASSTKISPPLEVQVAYVDGALLITLLIAGFLVATLTAGAIIRGHFQEEGNR